MTHDPMCDDHHDGGDCPWCNFAARVREDEQVKRDADGPWFRSVVHECCERVQTERAAALRDAVEAVKACDDLQPSWWKSMFFGGRRARAWCQYGWDWHKRDAVAAIEALGGKK